MAIFWPSTSNRSFSTYGCTTLFPSSSMETPSTTNPLSPYRFSRSMSQGISVRQGSHQVAQKLTSTTLPANCCRLVSLPLRSLSTSSGAGFIPAVEIFATGFPVSAWRGPTALCCVRHHEPQRDDDGDGGENPAGVFHDVHSPLEREVAVQESQFTRQPDEVIRENQRAGHQQQNALNLGLLRSGDQQHRSQDRPDARRPSEGERESQQDFFFNDTATT